MAASVEQVTQQLADTTIQPADEGAHSISAAEGRRLYIGNLAYSTTEAELKDFFKNFSVESVSIPTNPRTSRAVGYAFVDVSTKEEAERAIGELSGKEVLERKVSVQVARRPTAASPGSGPEGGERAPRRGGRGGGRGGTRGDRGDRGGRGGARGGRPAGRPRAEGAPKEGEAPAAAPAAPEQPATNSGGEDKENAATRQKKKKGPPENGVPSTTKVMVANLPYELSEEKLKELFAAYDPEAAKIALRPIPRFMVRKLQARGEARKGRGFGFVTLPTQEMQKKAVDEMNGKVVDGREIAVKVAIDNPKLEGEEGGEEGAEQSTNGVQDTPAPAATES